MCHSVFFNTQTKTSAPKMQHQAARKIQKSWRSTTFLVHSLKLNFHTKVEAVRRKPVLAIAKALAIRWRRQPHVDFALHVQPLLYWQWIVQKPKSLLAWQVDGMNNYSARDMIDDLHEAAKRLENEKTSQAYAYYVEKFKEWRSLDDAQKTTLLRCSVAKHIYAECFEPLLALAGGKNLVPKADLVKIRQTLGQMVGDTCLKRLDTELGSCRTMSTGQIAHELLYARRGKELINPQTGFGHEENACFMLVRFALPEPMYQAIEADLRNRKAGSGFLDCEPLLRALHEIQHAAQMSAIAGKWDFDLLAVKKALFLEPQCMAMVESVLEGMLESARATPGAKTLNWPIVRATITEKIAFLMESLGKIQACAFNLRLQMTTAPMLAYSMLPRQPALTRFTQTREWLFAAQRSRAQLRESNRPLRSLDFDTSLVAYATVWLVFASVDETQTYPETLVEYDEHRLVYLRDELKEILAMAGGHIPGVSALFFLVCFYLLMCMSQRAGVDPKRRWHAF